jgi:DNA-binding SARP family transcriptional activator
MGNATSGGKMSRKPQITLSFFGSVKISVGEREVKQIHTSRAQKLLYFLVLNRGRFFQREYLADLFWGDRDFAQAQGSLRTELWRIRTTFGNAHQDARLLFAETGAGIRFAPSLECVIDFEQFDAIMHDETLAKCERLQRAASLYSGDLLAGIDDHWCIYFRELYRTRYLSMLDEMIDINTTAKRYREAIDLAIQFLICDPFAEHVQVKLMECYAEIGNRAAAIRQFDTYRHQLAATFNITPMPETIALAERIKIQSSIRETPKAILHVHEQMFTASRTTSRDVAQATSSIPTY